MHRQFQSIPDLPQLLNCLHLLGGLIPFSHLLVQSRAMMVQLGTIGIGENHSLQIIKCVLLSDYSQSIMNQRLEQFFRHLLQMFCGQQLGSEVTLENQSTECPPHHGQTPLHPSSSCSGQVLTEQHFNKIVG